MAKVRQIQTKFWSDSYVQTLAPEEKLFLLYLLTNEHTNILGIYEITMRTMVFESGLDEGQITEAMHSLSKANKAYYEHGFVILVNFIKNQSLNPKVVAGINREWTNLSGKVKEFIIANDSLSIAYDSLSYLTKLNFNLTLTQSEKQKNTIYSQDAPKQSPYEDFDKFKLNDGSIAEMRWGKWVDASNPGVKINKQGYPELPI